MANDWASCYTLHFQRRFGKPFDIRPFRSDEGLTVRLATYDLAYRKFRVYGSLGLADLIPKDGVHGEVICVVDDFGPDAPYLFANAVLFVAAKSIPLDSRFTVGGIDAIRPGFAEFFDKSALYFMPAEGFGVGFADVRCPAGPGKVFQAIFVSDEEQDYIARKGGEAFEAKIKAQNADVCVLRRLSCV